MRRIWTVPKFFLRKFLYANSGLRAGFFQVESFSGRGPGSAEVIRHALSVVTHTCTSVAFDILLSTYDVLQSYTSMMWLPTLLLCMIVSALVEHTIPTMRILLECAVTPVITPVIPCDPV